METNMNMNMNAEIQLTNKGDLAIIEVNNGTLRIYFGKLNKNHKELHIIDNCIVIGNELTIKARRAKYIYIDVKMTDKGEQINFNGRILDMFGIENITHPDIKKDLIRTHTTKRNWFMKLLGKKDESFKYLMKEDASQWNGVNEKKIKLKEEYWTPVMFVTTVYIFEKM